MQADHEQSVLEVQIQKTNEFKVHQEVMLSETPFGQKYWSGPGIIVEVKASKIRVKFGNKQKDYFPDRLRHLEDFVQQGEEYVLKIVDQKTDPVSVSVQKDILAPTPAPEQQAAIWIQAIKQTDHKQRELIRAVRSKAEQLIKDQQTEDLVINL